MPKVTIKNTVTPRKNIKPVTVQRTVISDEEVIQKVFRQYKTAWKKLAKL